MVVDRVNDNIAMVDLVTNILLEYLLLDLFLVYFNVLVKVLNFTFFFNF